LFVLLLKQKTKGGKPAMSKTTYIQRYGTGEAQRRLAKIAKYIDKVAFGQTTPDEVRWYVLRTMRADIPYPESRRSFSSCVAVGALYASLDHANVYFRVAVAMLLRIVVFAV
jgi:hypothetical protein